jgi:hypothetical protein
LQIVRPKKTGRAMILNLTDLLERAYRLGWNDCVDAVEKVTDPIKRDAGAQYQTPKLLTEVRTSEHLS